MSAENNKIIVLQYFDNAIDANIAKTKLDAYGVPCFLTEEHMATLYPGQSFNAFKVRLHLFAADRERAIQILHGDSLTVQGDGSFACPRCHSHRVTRGFPKKVADSLTYLLFGVFFPHKKVNICLDCGTEF